MSIIKNTGYFVGNGVAGAGSKHLVQKRTKSRLRSYGVSLPLVYILSKAPKETDEEKWALRGGVVGIILHELLSWKFDIGVGTGDGKLIGGVAPGEGVAPEVSVTAPANGEVAVPQVVHEPVPVPVPSTVTVPEPMPSPVTPAQVVPAEYTQEEVSRFAGIDVDSVIEVEGKKYYRFIVLVFNGEWFRFSSNGENKDVKIIWPFWRGEWYIDDRGISMPKDQFGHYEFIQKNLSIFSTLYKELKEKRGIDHIVEFQIADNAFAIVGTFIRTYFLQQLYAFYKFMGRSRDVRPDIFVATGDKVLLSSGYFMIDTSKWEEQWARGEGYVATQF